MLERKSSKTGLFFLAALLILFGAFVLSINVTLLYKGMTVVEKIDIVEGKEVTEKPVQPTRKKNIPLPTEAPEEGDEIGRLLIPKLNISIPIFHGTTNQILTKGIGHVIGTAFPGEKNNTVLSGHRDTVFRKLGDLVEGDVLEVENHFGLFTYRIRKIRIVEADDSSVIVPKPYATLTVSTCYPFSYVGSASQRYILVANLINSQRKRA